MNTRCASCGTELPAGAGRCPQCLALVKPPGFFQRLLDKFNVTVNVNTTSTPSASAPGIHVKTTVHRTIKIRDAKTGELKEYHSLDEVPAEYREKVAQVFGQAAGSSATQIRFTGADGVTRTYKSIKEVPPDIRALMERAQANPGSK